MQLYNYDYDDMRDIVMTFDQNADIEFTSSIYPIKLEVKIDEEVNRPYLYYEGIVQTNKGFFKITLPKLDLALRSVSYDTITRFNRYDPWVSKDALSQVMGYKLVTEVTETSHKNKALFWLEKLSVEEYKDIAKQVWNGVKIVGKDTNGED